jgi:hypothetical protein
MIVFALFVAIAFATLLHDHPREQVTFGARVFGAFVAGGLLLGWVLYPFPL